MPKIIFRTSGGEVEVDALVGDTLLEVAQKNGVSLFGGCSGAGVCGTCHVLIPPEFLQKLNEPSDHEADLLEVLPMSKENSRLACQVVVTDELDGLIVNIP
ncbi:MAG: 2Fe-2S iron-sulfur cluster binding domain-containing protein [Holosporales bacterium]|jgi:2Fe-2S ferredoxin|nr:2Fe-2S iron-sulfur cluster binding domain-containing protein [Holosporales bacterium]